MLATARRPLLCALLCCAVFTARAAAAPAEGASAPEPGDALEPIRGAPYNSVWGSGPDNIWAVGLSGQLGRWNGAAFVPQSSTAHEHLRALWGTGPDDVWALGMTESIHFDGSTARLVPSASGLCLTAMWGSDRAHAWAVGRSGVVLRLDRGELRRESVPVAESIELTAIWGSSANDVWIVGQQGTILHQDGSGFRPVNVGPAAVFTTLYSVWGSSAADVWIAGEAGVLLHLEGTRWQRQRSGTREKLRGIWGSGPSDVWIVGEGGIALHWNGRDLVTIHEGGETNFWSVWGVRGASGREVFIGTPAGPLRWRLQQRSLRGAPAGR